MSDILPFTGPGSSPSQGKKARKTLFFDRLELQQILALYGSHVATGEWRDYAIDHCPGRAVFSIFRHSHESPLYCVHKIPGTGKQPFIFEVYSGPRRLNRGARLREVLDGFDRRLQLVGLDNGKRQ